MMSRTKMGHATCGAVAAMVLALGPIEVADACSRILWNDNKLAVVVGRTMDWPESTEPVLTVFPRGVKRNGGRLGPDIVVNDNALSWSAKYGSLVTTIYGVGTADGLNERGLGVHMLFLNAADFGPRDPSKPGIHGGLWAQYLLDNAATVTEALALLEKVQIVMTEARGTKTTVHLAIEDASGDSAIIEYIGGKRVVHHGREFKLMTNDPTVRRAVGVAEENGLLQAEQRHAFARQCQAHRPLSAGRLLLVDAAGAQDRARSGGGGVGDCS